jgi:hypothetical protein
LLSKANEGEARQLQLRREREEGEKKEEGEVC